MILRIIRIFDLFDWMFSSAGKKSKKSPIPESEIKV